MTATPRPAPLWRPPPGSVPIAALATAASKRATDSPRQLPVVTTASRAPTSTVQWAVGSSAMLHLVGGADGAPRFLTDAITVTGVIRAVKPHFDAPNRIYCYFETRRIFPYNVRAGLRVPPSMHGARRMTEMGELHLEDCAVYAHERFSYRFDGWYAADDPALLPLDDAVECAVRNGCGGRAARSRSASPSAFEGGARRKASGCARMCSEASRSRSRSRSRSAGARECEGGGGCGPGCRSSQKRDCSKPYSTSSSAATPAAEMAPSTTSERAIVGTNEWDSDAPQTSFADIKYLGFTIDPWFRAPFAALHSLAASYPDTARHAWSLHVCHRCLAPAASRRAMEEHLASYCSAQKPPGTTIYKQPLYHQELRSVASSSTNTIRKPTTTAADSADEHHRRTASPPAKGGPGTFLRIRLVDGAKEQTYCYNLSMLMRCFIESKSLECDVDIYEFYIATVPLSVLWDNPSGSDPQPQQQQHEAGASMPSLVAEVLRDYDVRAWPSREVVAGYFCRPKHAKNLSLCIISVLPPFQRLGLGSLMLRVAIHLTHIRQTVCGCEEFCGREGGKVGEPYSHAGHGLVNGVVLRWISSALAGLCAAGGSGSGGGHRRSASTAEAAEGRSREHAIPVDDEPCEEQVQQQADGEVAGGGALATSPAARSGRGRRSARHSERTAALRGDAELPPAKVATLGDLLGLCPGLHLTDMLAALQWRQALVCAPSSTAAGQAVASPTVGVGSNGGAATLGTTTTSGSNSSALPGSPTAVTQPPKPPREHNGIPVPSALADPTAGRSVRASPSDPTSPLTSLSPASNTTQFGLIFNSEEVHCRPDRLPFDEKYILKEDGFGRLHDPDRPRRPGQDSDPSLTPLYHRYIHFFGSGARSTGGGSGDGGSLRSIPSGTLVT